MAKKFGKFLAFTAVVGAACGAVYYVLGKKNEGEGNNAEDDSSAFFEKNNDREYVSLNSETMNEAAEKVSDAVDAAKEAAGEAKEAIRNKLNEAARELDEKAKEVAEGVGLVKEKEKDTSDFEFEDFATEEDAQ
ncbi:MAG: hypothetical protein K6E53_01945 [Lachnospiraceae bacterium]|nr:hypothetical protein [Lachnospiraceae bacterium]